LLNWSGGVFTVESWRSSLRGLLGWLMDRTAGEAPALRERVDPRLVGAGL